MPRIAAIACIIAALLAAPAGAARGDAETRLATRPFLNLPQTAAGQMPRLLSQTGAFSDVRTLAPSPGLIPYDLVVSFWSDGADKSRLVAIPAGKVAFSPDGEWRFPRGTVFVKTFELAKRRLETRLLVLDRDGGVYGVTYKWRADLSDAELVGPAGLEEPVAPASPGRRSQLWSYPSRQDCLSCHNERTAGQLGPKTRQLNHDFHYPDGAVENEIVHWSRLGLFDPSPSRQGVRALPSLAKADDPRRSLEDRARSYLDANCAQCHRPGGTVANFDARYQTPLKDQNLIDGPVLISQGLDRPRVVSPHDPWRSLIIRRIDTNDDARMPPIARHTIDEKGVALLKAWIESLPGRDVLAPPALKPAGGEFKSPVKVALSSPDAGAQIHYTLDGSAPGPDDPVYSGPIPIDGPTVVRARAYKDGLTRSIVVQQTYVVGR